MWRSNTFIAADYIVQDVGAMNNIKWLLFVLEHILM